MPLIAKVAGKGNVSIAQRASDSFHLNERLSTHPTRDEQNVPVDKREATPDAFVIKYEVNSVEVFFGPCMSGSWHCLAGKNKKTE